MLYLLKIERNYSLCKKKTITRCFWT